MAQLNPEPRHDNYDIVIVGGAMIGASIAWYISVHPDFDGRVLVVERDPSYEFASTSHTNSCMRQQFSNEINVKVSQYAAEFIRDFRNQMGGDPDVPQIALHSFGYMYMASEPASVRVLQENHKLQQACGAGTRLLTPEQLAEAFPFYDLSDILIGSYNPVDEGYFDGGTVFDWWRRAARRGGVEFVSNEVVAMRCEQNHVVGVTLKSGTELSVGAVVNASGPRATATAAMARLALPVEPRKRYTYVFEAEQPLDCDLPLTVDPSGVHIRTDGAYYMAGSPPQDGDPAVAYDDFVEDHALWEDKVWPAIATRIPQFEAIKVRNSWVGHYAYNTLDQNAVLGPHDEVSNFYFANGFSGHGFQQAPAMGRGMAELICSGGFQTLDLSAFSYGRIVRGEPFLEKAVI
ncbi:MAG: FAD-binding oxidoreductase [Rhodobacteraceae bacterium]|nr:FAD-binding oxidoreductase [Paracoccaceae bacterium]